MQLSRKLLILGGLATLGLSSTNGCSQDERTFGEGSGGGAGSGGIPASCTDSEQNGDETDVDCGGSCAPCADGASCTAPDDCVGATCTSENVCCTPLEEAALCEGKCESVDNCGEPVDCGGCAGEATCGGGGTDNVCGCAAPPCALWSASFGDAADDRVVGIAVDSEGNAYLTGTFRGSITFGEETHTASGSWGDIFLVKFDEAGVLQWSKSFGDSSDQGASALAVDGAGNVILVGTSSGTVNFGGSDLVTDSDIVIAKFDSDGGHVFSASYGDTHVDFPMSVATDPATNDIVVTGGFWGTLKFGTNATLTAAGDQSYYDMFVARFSALGAPQSSKRFGDGSEQIGQSIAVSGHHVYVAATFRGTFDFGLPNANPLTAVGYSDLALAKLGKSTFAHAWSRQYGEAYDVKLAADAAGNLYVTGDFTGEMAFQEPPLQTDGWELFVAKLDPDGNPSWSKQFAGVSPSALHLAPDGTLLLAGDAWAAVDFGGGVLEPHASGDVFIAKLDANGDHVWSRTLGSEVGAQYGMAIAGARDGATWVGAHFQGQLDFGLSPHQTEGSFDVAAAKFAPAGN